MPKPKDHTFTFTFNESEAALDVSNLNHLEKGAYLDLVLAQRRFGKFTIDQIKKILGKNFPKVWAALEYVLIEDNGRYYIQWIYNSLEKKQKQSDKQRMRIANRWNKIKDDNSNNQDIEKYHGNTAVSIQSNSEYHGNTAVFSDLQNSEILSSDSVHTLENDIKTADEISNIDLLDKQDIEEYHGNTMVIPRYKSEEIKDAIIYNNIDISSNIEIYNNIDNIKEKIKKRKNNSNNMNQSEKPTWRNSYEVYLLGLKKVYDELRFDPEFIKQQEKYYPNVDIVLSLEMAFNNFWGTEAGWKHKKKQRSNDINWKLTLVNAIKMNKVYKQNNRFNSPSSSSETKVQHKDLTKIFEEITS